jgi:DNA-binding MarR family transcriptional regulator
MTDFLPLDPVERPRRTGVLLRRAHQVAVAIFTAEASALGLTPPQHNVLAAIAANPGSHQTELSRLVGYDRATVGAVIAGLEGRGLIARKGTAADRRLKTLSPTAKGAKLLRASTTVMQRINEALLAPLDAREREQLVALLSKVARYG